ncbi:MAG: glycosyltransferase [Phycisphaerae bacterium]
MRFSYRSPRHTADTTRHRDKHGQDHDSKPAAWGHRLNGADITIIIATHNRRETLLNTLERVTGLRSQGATLEIIVVDNASTDGTPGGVAERFKDVTVLARRDNRGSCAKAYAVDRASGRFIVFLDDDSHPQSGCLDRMIGHFNADDRLGAAGFVVHLPDGRCECSAFGNVFVGCGVGFRAEALRAVGGLDADFFMQAEEFDLSFRLINAGWGVETFDDLHVDHLKTPQARLSARTTFYDTRNNLRIVDRYLCGGHRRIYRQDWMQRYYWLAVANRHRGSFFKATLAALLWARRDRHRFAHSKLTPAAFETLFRHRYTSMRMTQLRKQGISSVVFADLGKNIYAFYRAARRAYVTIMAVVDDRFASPGRRYRGIPIVPTAAINTIDPHAVVISNTAPVHAEATEERLKALVTAPVHRWFGFRSAFAAHFSSTGQAQPADMTQIA